MDNQDTLFSENGQINDNNRNGISVGGNGVVVDSNKERIVMDNITPTAESTSSSENSTPIIVSSPQALLE
ncbi:hypothetical protein ABK040_009625 [Willaertia magna]